jgi:hypothetical protein
MNKLFFSLMISMITSIASFAQCDKNFVINSSKTEYLSADSSVERAVEENTIIEVTRPTISITPAGKKMTATIKSETCNWTTPFIEGKTVIKATFTDEQGEAKNATITIEGKNGKLMLWVTAEEMPTIIRVAIDKFEQKN